MINTAVLVGKLIKNPEIVETPNGKNVCEITLAIKRPFKNATTHQYDTDFIKIVMWEALAININEYCKKGCTVGIRARIQSKSIKLDSGYLSIPEIVGEQLVFIAKGKANDEKDVTDLADDGVTELTSDAELPL